MSTEETEVKEATMEVVSDVETSGEDMDVEVSTPQLPLKSATLAMHKALMDRNDELVVEMQAREYPIEFKNKKLFDKLLKSLEQKAPWTHRTAAGLIMLFHNLREEKVKTRDKDWDGIIALRSANVSILWQMFVGMTGEGFYEARDFVELMATIGEPISKAVASVHADNQELKDNHTELEQIDQLIDARAWEDDIDVEREDHNTSVDLDEIDPVVE